MVDFFTGLRNYFRVNTKFRLFAFLHLTACWRMVSFFHGGTDSFSRNSKAEERQANAQDGPGDHVVHVIVWYSDIGLSRNRSALDELIG